MDLPIPASRDQSTSAPRVDFESPLFQRSRIALRLLHDAYLYAEHQDGSIWDFAEEIDGLRRCGITNSDLRLLVCVGYVEHGHEITKIGEERRTFRRDEGLYFSKKTCFVLSELGVSFVSGSSTEAPQNKPLQVLQTDDTMEPEAALKPVWNRELQELRLGDVLVKRFKVPAPNQEIILAVFQEENWPVYIDDPLPPHPEIDSKRRLRDTINSLNRNQKNHLIQFRGNGTGDGVRWELFPSEGPSD